MIILGVVVAAVVAAVTVAVGAAGRPEPACGCTAAPNLRGPAHDTAVRFEALVRQADVSGAWALLTDGARSRYADEAGFRPVFDRLGTALQGAGAAGGGAAGGWLVVADQVNYFEAPSEAVLVRSATGPPRMLWALLVVAPLGHPGAERVDPEPAALQLTAAGDGGGVRVELPDGDLDRASFVVIDGAGRHTLPAREQVTGDVDRLIWHTPPKGPLVIVAAERRSTGWRVGAAAATAG